jgi:FlaA1/EpsC-like NDP-sugar epimerase
LRLGETLYEALLIGDDPSRASHLRIMKVREEFGPWSELEGKLKALGMVLNVNDAGVARLMRQQLVTRLRVQ